MDNISDTELEVLHILWEHGSLKPAEIQKQFSRQINNATLRSLLLVLVEKGLIDREKVGKAYYYTARIPKQKTMKSMVNKVLDIFFGGSPSELVAQLIKDELLSGEDIRAIRNAAESEMKESRKSTKERKQS